MCVTHMCDVTHLCVPWLIMTWLLEHSHTKLCVYRQKKVRSRYVCHTYVWHASFMCVVTHCDMTPSALPHDAVHTSSWAGKIYICVSTSRTTHVNESCHIAAQLIHHIVAVIVRTKYSLLHLEWHFSNLTTQSIILFSTSLLPHSVEMRPMGAWQVEGL